jgi:AbrB family looped-hinge helix DNA binding protein
MGSKRAKVSADGSVTIPPEYREALGLKPGGDVVLALEDGELRLFTVEHGLRRAQEIARKFVPEGRCLSDELIAERRAEAERE